MEVALFQVSHEAAGRERISPAIEEPIVLHGANEPQDTSLVKDSETHPTHDSEAPPNVQIVELLLKGAIVGNLV